MSPTQNEDGGMAMAMRRKAKVRQVIRGVQKAKERRQKEQVRRKACSEPWVEQAFTAYPAVDEEGKPLEVKELDKRKFPVWGQVQCRGCERFVPPIDLGSSGHCSDCRLGAMSKMQLSRLQGSASVINMARVKAAIRRGATTVQGGV